MSGPTPLLKPDAAPEVHAHGLVGRSDGPTLGGHLLAA
jgi:predicted DNA-binding protein with PD1-like motif